MTAVTLYLASASPRRKDILNQLAIPFEILAQNIDEKKLADESPADYVCRLAKSKAEAALDSLENKEQVACLGSDTTVVCENEIFEKPVDEADAIRILSFLSGRTHQVMTAVALATQEIREVSLSISHVTFRVLTDNEIRAYWLTGEPADKAGAYGIQGLGSLFIDSISGSYSGIMGLPVTQTVALLEKVGITAEKILGGNL